MYVICNARIPSINQYLVILKKPISIALDLQIYVLVSSLDVFRFLLVPPEILERHFRHLYDEKRVKGYAMAQMEVKRRTISSLTIEEGYNLILICTVSGKPKPRVTWSRNKVVIKNDTRHLLLPNGVLLVRHVLVKESGQYKCVATNPAGEDQGIVQLTVKDQAKGE